MEGKQSSSIFLSHIPIYLRGTAEGLGLFEQYFCLRRCFAIFLLSRYAHAVSRKPIRAPFSAPFGSPRWSSEALMKHQVWCRHDAPKARSLSFGLALFFIVTLASIGVLLNITGIPSNTFHASILAGGGTAVTSSPRWPFARELKSRYDAESLHSAPSRHREPFVSRRNGIELK